MTDSDLCIKAKPPKSGEPDITRRDQSIDIRVAHKVNAVDGLGPLLKMQLGPITN